MEQMTDRKLLEFAAKAAGISFFVDSRGREMQMHGGLMPAPWNPLADDGDALRLAVRLRFEVQCYPGMAGVIYDDGSPDGAYLQQNPMFGQSDEQATRRAIVRAAAAIGQSMP